MKYLAISTLIFSCCSFADNQDSSWLLGQYTVEVIPPCNVQVSSNNSSQLIQDPFGNGNACQVETLVETNIPNALVIGGAHVLVLEQQIEDGDACRKISKALYLPVSGEVAVSERSNRIGHCKTHVEPEYVMYLVSPLSNSTPPN